MNTSTLTSSQTIARFASAPENPVISMMASVVEENPAVPLLSATKVRVAPASTKEKVAARLARKVVVVRTALMPAKPLRVLAPELPVMVLARGLPVPDNALVPVRIRF